MGLGHIKRDLAIARELLTVNPGLEISWLASSPASLVIKEAGETLLPEAENYADETSAAENAAKGYRLEILKYLSNARESWTTNVRIFERVTSKGHYDIVIGDETYDLSVAQQKRPELNKKPFVMLYDFIGIDSLSINPLDRFSAYMWNRIWVEGNRKLLSGGRNLALFIGEPEDVPDKKFGFMLPNRRLHAQKYYTFLGYVLGFDPKEYSNRSIIREKLGYGEEPFVVCSVGGTSVGKDLLELCGQSYQMAKAKIPGLRMLLVCGPRISPGSLKVPPGVEIKQFIPELYEYFAACDLAIVQGGGTSTLELTALMRPFLYFPLEGHFEQEISVASRLARHRAGQRMRFSQTTPEKLAEKIIGAIGKAVDYEPIHTDGARKAAQLITALDLKENGR
ncbi:MAG: glycosyltransferase [Chitinivibrionales bacterium]